MFLLERIARGWRLTKASFRVLNLDKEILALPMIAGVLMIVALVGFGWGAFGLGLFPEEGITAAGLLALFGIYVLVYAISIYFNVAVIEMATIRFNGGDPVLKDGFRFASRRVTRIVQWALVAATVGIIFRILRDYAREHLGFLGQLLVGFLEAGWGLATFFVVPIAVYQDVGPFQAIKGSTRMMKRTWGESMGGIITTGIIFLLLGLVGILPIVAGVMLLPTSFTLGLVLVATGLVYWIVLTAVHVAVDGILVAGLYKFANEGRLPEAFEEAGIEAQQLTW